jgi:diaminohydroxyphosphoribosylaminopyrimidine deaminase/5-amino-6-(5-phosphoribosylamino)uracil reductase
VLFFHALSLFLGHFYFGLESEFMHETFMKRALDLASKGKHHVDLNPMVGAIIVKDNTIISEGYHEVYGGPHAERNAIDHAKENVEGSTMYVTLEPCSHYGKTPPCADYIISHNIKKVVVASLDPNPLVAGNGIKKLKDAGIEVDVGLLDKENKALNKIFYKYMMEKMPYVTIKTAMSLDGKIATRSNDSRWITNELSRQMVHKLREEYKAIMVGINTVLKDDPMLNVRTISPTHQPIRIIVDSTLKIPLQSKLSLTTNTFETIVITTKNHQDKKKQALEKLGVKIMVIDDENGKVNLQKAMIKLAQIGINSLLVEGGGTLNETLFKEKLVDEVITFIAPKIIGGKDAPTPVEGLGINRLVEATDLTLIETQVFDEDIMLRYKVKEVN